MSSNKPVKITLFHADWCGHCTDFMPTWESMNADKNAKKNIEFTAYEESEMKDLSESENQIEGFPTIKILVHGKNYDYRGQRDPANIYGFVVKKLKKSFNIGSENSSESVTVSKTSQITMSSSPFDNSPNSMMHMQSDASSVGITAQSGGNEVNVPNNIPMLNANSIDFTNNQNAPGFASRIGKDVLNLEELNSLSEMFTL